MAFFQVGDNAAALRILAIELQDMVAAEQYCAEQQAKGGKATHAVLMDMLLHPGNNRTPLLAQACHLLAAQGQLQLETNCYDSIHVHSVWHKSMSADILLPKSSFSPNNQLVPSCRCALTSAMG